MKMLKNGFVTISLFVFILLGLTACGNGEPAKYDAPKNAPYEGLYVIDRMNYSSSYSYSKGVSHFEVTMKWRTEDENIDYAEFTDEYYLEWCFDEMGFYELCKPVNDMSNLKNNKYTIKPGEDVSIVLDVDSYFEDLPVGYYRFVKIFNIINKDGTSKQEVASFEFDLSN